MLVKSFNSRVTQVGSCRERMWMHLAFYLNLWMEIARNRLSRKIHSLLIVRSWKKGCKPVGKRMKRIGNRGQETLIFLLTRVCGKLSYLSLRQLYFVYAMSAVNQFKHPLTKCIWLKEVQIKVEYNNKNKKLFSQ